MSEPELLAPARRLHWTSLFFGLGPVARSALPLLVLVVLSRELGWQFWALLALIPSTIGPVVRVFTLRYRLEAHELVVTEGLLSRSARHVPYERIQHVEVKQGVLQRLLHVADVKVESAGGAEAPEARFTVLSLADAEALRAQIAARRAVAEAPTVQPEATLLRLSVRDVVLLGAAEGRGWLVIGAALGVLWQLDDFIDVPVLEWINDPAWWRSLAGGGTVLPSIAAAVAGAFAVILLFRVLSIGWALVKLHGFTLTRDEDVLRTRYGLWTRFSAAIPRHRVQRLMIVEPPLLRLLGRASIKVETAGRFEADEGGVGARWLAPLVARDRIGAIVAEVLPGTAPSELPWEPMADGTRTRLFRRYVLWAALATGVLSGTVGWWALAILPGGILVAWAASRGVAREEGYALTGDAVAYRSGWWTRHTSIVRVPRIQVLSMSDDVFDRRWGMAALRVDTAGASAGHGTEIPFLPRERAEQAFLALRAATARTDLQW